MEETGGRKTEGTGKVLLFASTKGGVGKSTCVMNIAVMLAIAGYKCKIFDVDKQRSVGDWSDLRVAAKIEPRIHVEHRHLAIKDHREAGVKGKAFVTEIREAAEDNDFCLVDVGGEDNPALRMAMIACDEMFVPLSPSSLDTWALANLEEVWRLVSGTGQNPSLVPKLYFSRVSPHSNERRNIDQIMTEYNEFEYLDRVIVFERAQFRRATEQGRALVEMPRPDTKGVGELLGLYRAVIGEDWIKRRVA